MAGFSAQEAMRDLAYDFRPLVDAFGVVPEPSRERLKQFIETISKLQTEDVTAPPSPVSPPVASVVPVIPAEPASDTEPDVDEDKDEKAMNEEWINAFAEFCQGHPTAEQLTELGVQAPRMQWKFAFWLIEAFVPRPTIYDTNGSRAIPTSV